MAFLHHIWSRIGYRLGDGRAILRDYVNNVPTVRRKWHYDQALRELWLSPFDLREETMHEYLELLHRYEVRWLYGVPSAISTLANHARRSGWQPPTSFRGVLPGSETLFDNQRRCIAEAFGDRPILPFYGLTERVAIAGEVLGQPQTYAFEPLYGVTELLDERGVSVSREGQRGQIVATGFWSQEFVFGRNGEPISAVSLDQHNYAGVVREYQYYQDTLGRIVMKIVPCTGVSAENLEAVLRPIRQRVGGVLDISIELVDQLPIGPTGKRSFVDQKLEL